MAVWFWAVIWRALETGSAKGGGRGGGGGGDGGEGFTFGTGGGEGDGIDEFAKELVGGWDEGAGIVVGCAHEVVEGAAQGLGSGEVGGAVVGEVGVALDELWAAEGVDELCEGEGGCGEVDELPTEREGDVESAGVSEEGDVVVAGEGQEELCGEGDEQEPEVAAFDESAIAPGAEVGPSEFADVAACVVPEAREEPGEALAAREAAWCWHGGECSGKCGCGKGGPRGEAPLAGLVRGRALYRRKGEGGPRSGEIW